MNRVRARLIPVLVIVLGVGLYFAYQSYNNFKNSEQELEHKRVAWQQLRKTLFQEVKQFVGQVGLVIKDLGRNWEVFHDKDALLPAASIVKIPIMAACYYAAEQEKINLQDKIKLKAKQRVGGSGILKQMPPGIEFSIEELIELMVVRSDNTAANILIDLLGFDYLNDFFKQTGLINTNLSRKMMDFRSRKRGIENYTTAADMACILEKIYRGQLCNKQTSQRCLDLLKRQQINDRIPAKLPPGLAVAHKTGLERSVCHDAGILLTEKGDLLVCVLVKNKNSKKAKEFIATVALYAYNYL